MAATENTTPQTPAKPKMKSLTVSVPEDVYAFLDEVQWDTRTKLSAIVREGVIDKAKALGFGAEGKPAPKNVG